MLWSAVLSNHLCLLQPAQFMWAHAADHTMMPLGYDMLPAAMGITTNVLTSFVFHGRQLLAHVMSQNIAAVELCCMGVCVCTWSRGYPHNGAMASALRTT